jgi:two-component system sensor histidine kinase GlrK
MTLAAKISAGFLFLVMLMVVLSWSQLALIYRLHAEGRKLSQISLETASSSLRLQGQVARLRELSHKHLVLQDPAYATEAGRVREEIEVDLDRLRALELGAGERRELERLTELWQAYATAAQQRGRAVAAPRRAGREEQRERLDETFDAVDGQLRRLALVSRAAMASQVADSGARVERARWIAWGATLAGLLAAALVSAGIVRSLVRPLRRLAHGTRALADGDFDHRVPPRGGPELEALAADFNAMAKQLSELDRLKKDFLANVSHDLKTPLASMQEATKLLLDDIPGPLTQRQRRLLQLNLESGERLFRMIEDLLHLSRLEAGTVDYSPRRQDLVGLARTAVDEIGALIGDRGLELEEDFPDQQVVVACDGPAVLRVLRNLLANAVEYTPAGGAVGIRVRALGDRSELPPEVRGRWPGERYLPAAEVAVWDTGPGIPDDHKQRIFERFVRLEGSGPRGTGLGLAIAREVVAGHGGELWVEDRSERGSCFRAVLWSQPPPEGPSRAGGREEAAAAAGRRQPASWAALAVLAVSLTSSACCGHPPPVVQPGALEIGDAAFDRGDYVAASGAYQDHLDHGASSSAADRVLFRLALMHLLPGSPVRDPRRAREYLAALVERFPESPFRAAAEYLFGLQREVELLRRQLEEIKRIDLEGGSPAGG